MEETCAAQIRLESIENKTRIKTFLESFDVEESTSMASYISESDQVSESDGTYFVDDRGNYYYQPTGIQPSDTATDIPEECYQNVKAEGIGQLPSSQDESFPTVTVTSDGGEVSYIILVQEDADNEAAETTAAEKPSTFEFDESDGSFRSSAENKRPRLVKTKKSFICTFCDYTSTKQYLLKRHLKKHSEERPFQCSVCERGFKTRSSLVNHTNTHAGVKPHACKYCKSAFTTSGELVRHVRYRHTREKPHACTECDYSSVELSKLKRHVRCHTGERPYQCPHCTYASPDTFKLKRHLRTHTGEKPYRCEQCGMNFTQSNSLKQHRFIHSVVGKPVYQCELCPVTCGRKTDLRLHVQKQHTSDRLIPCRVCDMSFPDRYTHRLHTKTHSGQKCYKCNVCPYAAISQRILTSHMYRHTDVKPFACELCDRTFRQKQLLRRHDNLHHNAEYVKAEPMVKCHPCLKCQRMFAFKGNLIRHMATHESESEVQAERFALKWNCTDTSGQRNRKQNLSDNLSDEVSVDKIEVKEEPEPLEGEFAVLEVILLPEVARACKLDVLGQESTVAG